MNAHRDNLIHALEGFARFHLAEDPSSRVEYMDTCEELYSRWIAAYIKRDWFLERFSAEQRAALSDFDTCLRTSTGKCNSLPPILKWVTSADGKGLCARANGLLTLLRPA